MGRLAPEFSCCLLALHGTGWSSKGHRGHIGRSHLGVCLLCNRTQYPFHNVLRCRLRDRLLLGVGMDEGNLRGRDNRKKMHRPPCSHHPPRECAGASARHCTVWLCILVEGSYCLGWGRAGRGKCESHLITEKETSLPGHREVPVLVPSVPESFLGDTSCSVPGDPGPRDIAAALQRHREGRGGCPRVPREAGLGRSTSRWERSGGCLLQPAQCPGNPEQGPGVTFRQSHPLHHIW